MRYARGVYRKKEHWFDEVCVERNRETKDALTDFREKNDDTSRIKYWECRMLYEKIFEDKRNKWQEKQAGIV
jgi:hypothetical protein